MAVAEHLPVGLLKRGVGLADGPANMIVTNVPGPQFPLFSVGARLLGLYPVVPLLPGGGLGIALFSYEGKLCWGFNADSDLVPDPEAFAQDIRVSFETLRQATVTSFLDRRTAVPEQREEAEVETSAPRRKKAKAKGAPRAGNAPR